MLYAISSVSALLAFIQILKLPKDFTKKSLIRMGIFMGIFYLAFFSTYLLQKNTYEEIEPLKTFNVECEDDVYFYYAKFDEQNYYKSIIDPRFSILVEEESDKCYAVECVVYTHLKIGDNLTNILFFNEKMVPTCSKLIMYKIYVPKGTIYKSV